MTLFSAEIAQLFIDNPNQWFTLIDVVNKYPNKGENVCWVALRELEADGKIESRKANIPGSPVYYRYYKPIILNEFALHKLLTDIFFKTIKSCNECPYKTSCYDEDEVIDDEFRDTNNCVDEWIRNLLEF